MALFPTAAKTAAYSMVANDYVPGNAAGGSFVLTLPASPAEGTICGAYKTESSSNQVVLSPSGSDTIEGRSCHIWLRAQRESVELMYAGGSWRVLHRTQGKNGSSTLLMPGAATVSSAPGGVAWDVWLRADDLGLSNGQRVLSWPNRGFAPYVGAKMAYGSRASAPTYLASGINGLPSVDFNGTDQLMKLYGIEAGLMRPGAAIIVCRPDTFASSNRYLLGAEGSASGGRDWRFNQTSGALEYDRSGLTAFATASTGVSAGNAHIVAFRDDGTNVALYRDGTADGTGSNATGMAQAAQYLGGSWVTGPLAFLDGPVSEVLIRQGTAVTLTELTNAVATLSTRYGITVA